MNKERDNLWFMTLQLKFIFYLKRLKVSKSKGATEHQISGHFLQVIFRREIIQYLPTVIPSKGEKTHQDKKLFDSLKLF